MDKETVKFCKSNNIGYFDYSMSDFYFGNEIILSKGYITSNFPIHNASSLFNRELNKRIKKSIDELIKKSKFENLDSENDEQLKKIIISFFKKRKEMKLKVNSFLKLEK